MNHGHRSSPPGFPPQGGIQQRVNLVQVQQLGVSPPPLQRRERVAPSKHKGGKLVQDGDGAQDPRDRMQTSKEGERLFSSALCVPPTLNDCWVEILSTVRDDGFISFRCVCSIVSAL